MEEDENDFWKNNKLPINSPIKKSADAIEPEFLKIYFTIQELNYFPPEILDPLHKFSFSYANKLAEFDFIPISLFHIVKKYNNNNGESLKALEFLKNILPYISNTSSNDLLQNNIVNFLGEILINPNPFFPTWLILKCLEEFSLLSLSNRNACVKYINLDLIASFINQHDDKDMIMNSIDYIKSLCSFQLTVDLCFSCIKILVEGIHLHSEFAKNIIEAIESASSNQMKTFSFLTQLNFLPDLFHLHTLPEYYDVTSNIILKAKINDIPVSFLKDILDHYKTILAEKSELPSSLCRCVITLANRIFEKDNCLSFGLSDLLLSIAQNGNYESKRKATLLIASIINLSSTDWSFWLDIGIFDIFIHLEECNNIEIINEILSSFITISIGAQKEEKIELIVSKINELHGFSYFDLLEEESEDYLVLEKLSILKNVLTSPKADDNQILS